MSAVKHCGCNFSVMGLGEKMIIGGMLFFILCAALGTIAHLLEICPWCFPHKYEIFFKGFKRKEKEKKPMLGRLFTRKLRMELEEVRHKHKLEVDEIKANIEREKRHWAEDKTREVTNLKKEHDLKLKEAVTLAKLDSEQRIAQAKTDGDKKLNDTVEKLTKEHYDRLSTAMTKLHEEGNITTKFTQDLALKMFEKNPPKTKRIEKLTGSLDVK